MIHVKWQKQCPATYQYTPYLFLNRKPPQVRSGIHGLTCKWRGSAILTLPPIITIPSAHGVFWTRKVLRRHSQIRGETAFFNPEFELFDAIVICLLSDQIGSALECRCRKKSRNRANGRPRQSTGDWRERSGHIRLAEAFRTFLAPFLETREVFSLRQYRLFPQTQTRINTR